jgi:hypothetical protein
MEPMYNVSYYLQLQRRLVAAQGSSPKPLVDVAADQQSSSLRTDQGLLRLEIRDILAVASEEMNFEPLDANSRRIDRIKAKLTEMAWVFLLIAGLVTFSLACLLSPTLLG